MIKVNVILKNFTWRKYLKDPSEFFNQKIRLINKKDKSYKNKKLIFSLMLSDSLEIKRLNKRYRKKDKSTDVLSFPFYEKNDLKKIISKNNELYLGDIIINLKKIRHKANKTKFKKELVKIWIHGFVHLFGYTHKNDRNYNLMNKLEKKYLNFIN